MNENNYFEQLREIWRSGNSVENVDNFFPEKERLQSELIIFSPEKEYLSNIFKLGWLIGKKSVIISPFVSYRYYEYDYTYSETTTDTYTVDKEFFQWRDNINKHFDDNSYQILPSVLVSLCYDYCSDGAWNDVSSINSSAIVDKTNLNSQLTLPKDFVKITNKFGVNIDLPKLIINDMVVMKKVQKDYPIASFEFKKIIKDSYRIASESNKENLSQIDLMQKIQDEVVQPSLYKIQAEYKEIYKSSAIKAVSETAAIGLPLYLSFSTDINIFLNQLLSAGLLLNLSQNLVDLRKNVVEIKKNPFYSAMKMKF